MKKTFKRGFTLVELLVVISIIAMLAGLMLPAINSARESGRRTTCINNQRNIAVAFSLFEENKGNYPQFCSFTKTRVDTVPNLQRNSVHWVQFDETHFANSLGWIPQLFPYVEQVQMWDVINEVGCFAKDCDVTLELFICKSAGASEVNGNNYVGNCGIADLHIDGRDYIDQTKAYGLLTNGQGWGSAIGKKISIDDVKDGLSNTLLLSENIQSGTIWSHREYLVGFCVNYNTSDEVIDYEPLFNEGANPEDNPGIPFAPNRFRDEAEDYTSTGGFSNAGPVGWNVARMSSCHPGVVVAALADGSTRVVSEDVDVEILTKAMSPNDKATAFWKKNYFKSRTLDLSKLGE